MEAFLTTELSIFIEKILFSLILASIIGQERELTGQKTVSKLKFLSHAAHVSLHPMNP